ncbi:hypothetical protein [Streptomyces radicis]|uniref:Uncharacterized protein n=1 Tax=Streptomyces radicis TaxID=1750517 RepID=A0A3A9WMA6_9ACTN|nr:hypothetical protein [Streptomyces radicis]RKN07287.1 hypothetical protein D7319_19675 [Streptomyces radicis]RKN26697.1 hypothetical protein D7318_04875 [Streptomyces radicis]
MKPRAARVLAAALHAWTTPTPHPDKAAARLDIREPSRWEHTATINLTHGHTDRLIGLIRADVADRLPRHCSPEQTAQAIEQHLAHRTAAGHRTVNHRDLLDIARRTGQTTHWLAHHLIALLDTGRLRETWWRPHTYRITTPPPWAIRPGITARSTHR